MIKKIQISGLAYRQAGFKLQIKKAILNLKFEINLSIYCISSVPNSANYKLHYLCL